MGPGMDAVEAVPLSKLTIGYLSEVDDVSIQESKRLLDGFG
jgi:hypothetical protein